MALVSYLHKYFWDIDPKKARPRSYPEYYIKRVLEYGNMRAYEWLKRTYGLDKIRQVLKKSRLSPRSKNYWVKILS